MRIVLTRTGFPAAPRSAVPGGVYEPGADPSWRLFGYNEGIQLAPLAVPAEFMFTATAKDRRSLCDIRSTWKAALLVIDGLIAGGALSNRRDSVREIHVLAPIVTGTDGMIVHVVDAAERDSSVR